MLIAEAIPRENPEAPGLRILAGRVQSLARTANCPSPLYDLTSARTSVLSTAWGQNFGTIWAVVYWLLYNISRLRRFLLLGLSCGCACPPSTGTQGMTT